MVNTQKLRDKVGVYEIFSGSYPDINDKAESSVLLKQAQSGIPHRVCRPFFFGSNIIRSQNFLKTRAFRRDD